MRKQLGVRYVYSGSHDSPANQNLDRLRPEYLADLPSDLRTGLEAAIISLDHDRIIGAVNLILRENPRLGGILAGMTERLSYSAILRALRASANA
jgi:hypothetical protein